MAVPRKELHVVKQLAELGRPEILKKWRPDSCIASTRIALLVLREFGIRARPLPVEVLVFNDAYHRRVEREGRMPEGHAEVERWWEEDRAWGLGIGMRELSEAAPNAWNGCCSTSRSIRPPGPSATS